jgi:hypothetical protein
MDAFAFGAQRFAAGRENPHAGRAFENLFGHDGGGFHHMLATIQNQQHFLVAQMRDQRRDRVVGPRRHAECGHDRAGQQFRIADRSEIDEADIVAKGRHLRGCERKRDRGLADATGPDQRHEAPLRQLGCERRHDVFASDHTRKRGRNVRCWRRPRLDARSRRFGILERHRRDEGIAASWNIRDVTLLGPPFAQNLAQGRDVNAQISVLNKGLGPNPCDQFILGDGLAMTFDKRNQDIERAAAQPDRLSGLQ